MLSSTFTFNSPIEGILEFNIMRYNDDEGVCDIVKVIDYEDEYTLKHIIEGERIVIRNNVITVEFNFPLSKNFYFKYESKEGFTRFDLLRCIYKGYKKINGEGDQDYGIWGHVLEGLFLEGVWYSQNEKVVRLQIGS